MKKLLIRDLTLRDGQQSLFATRMKQEQIDRVLDYYVDANFYAMEVWGGAVPDSVMRFLGENPWTRLETIKQKIQDKSKLTALSRGRNLFGYNPYPEEVIEGFNKNAVESGIGIMRIFDCLNDVDNMESTIKYIKESGGMADCAVCYTVDPKYPDGQKQKEIFDIDYFVNKAKKMEALGADLISVKDMAGLIPPSKSGKIVKRLKEEINLPIDFHTHSTPGYGLASILMAIVNGVDIVDANIMTFAGGSAAPAFELIQIFADKLGLDTGVNLDSVYNIDKELRTIRKELADHDSYKQFPIEFDIRNYSLPKEIDELFDKAIELAKADKEKELLDAIHKIEEYFNFVAPNEKVKKAEIPGGMYTNMLSQLKQLGLDNLLDRVLEVVPQVRMDAGIPPLVTPSSQIVGAQAVNCVIDENNGKSFYTNVSTQFHNLVKGFYGKTPVNINPEFRNMICGVKEETPYDTSNYKKQDNPVLSEFGGMKLAENEKEELLLELFPAVAKGFLKKEKEAAYKRIKSQKRKEKAEARKNKKYKGKLKIRDLTLRDGQQSMFATRVTQAQIDKVLPYYLEADFYAMEVWGGAVPDSVMRYLGENPWDRLESIKRVIGNKSKLTALSRGRNLFGYNPYPDSVIEGFNKNAVKSGIDIMRIFDCLNDVDNMKSTIEYVKKHGGTADCAVCYTVDPKFTTKQKALALIKGKKLPKDIFTIDYFVNKAKQMEALGADMISVKDMAGLIPPIMAGKIVKRLKEEINLPIDFHTHCTPGYGLASVLTAIVNGVDIVDTNIWNFAGGPAAPAFELIQIFADKLDLDTGVNLDAVVKINEELKTIRESLSNFDSCEKFPRQFDITADDLPEHIDELFNRAIKFAKDGNEEELLTTIHAIEEFFDFPTPNEEVKNAEIPGGMYTNMLAQLKQLGLENLLGKVLETVPMVRIDAGCPPLVTPTSQIVGAQAVNCVIDKKNGKPFYTNKTNQFTNLVKGSYGKTPIKVDPDFREKVCGIREETPYDTSNYQKPEIEILHEFEGVKIAENEKEELLLELFPAVAKSYLKKQKEKEFEKKKERYRKLKKEEKEAILMKGLMHESVLA